MFKKSQQAYATKQAVEQTVSRCSKHSEIKQRTIPIHVQRPGRHEPSKGPLQFETLAKKAPLIKNDGRQVKTTRTNPTHNPA
jgi:hypothetical protein